MVFFILNFFSFIFVARDMLSTTELMKNIYGVSDSEYQNPYVKYFATIIGLTLVLFLCSLSVVLAVFDYGKKKTNDFTAYTLTPANKSLMQTFELSYRQYMLYLAIFVYFIVFAHTTGTMRTIMLNIACIILSVILLSTSIYCCVVAVDFFNNKKYKRQLYQ
jgi:cbb3-type cytochrome oxidase subunit 3